MSATFSSGALNRFLKACPRLRACIVKDIHNNWMVHVYIPNGEPCYGHAITAYSRERDARRALRRLGYTQEGLSWKPPCRAVDEPEQEVSNATTD